LRYNANLLGVSPPPIADVQTWIQGVAFSPNNPLLDVAQAVPSYQPATELQTHLGHMAKAGASARYTAILGVPELRHALAKHLSDDYATNVPPASVGITAGCNQAFCIALSAVAGPGDQVILTLPYYFNHYMWLKMQGIEPVLLPMPPTGPKRPDPGELETLVTPRTRAIVLVSPNNPTGLEYPPSILAEVMAVARKAHAALVIDETYKDFRTRPGPPHHLFENPDWTETLIQLWSFSKSYSLTGYRVGSLVAGPRTMEQVEKVMDCIAICAARISQEAALYALANLGAWRDDKVKLMAQRRDELTTAFRANNVGYELLSCGAFFAYLRHPFDGRSGTAVARWLAREYGVMCVPGDMFGPAQGPFLRLAFANLETARVRDLVDRLADSQHGAP